MSNIDIQSAGGTGGGDAFGVIAVSGQSNVVADSATDTLTLVAGANVTITTDAASDSVTIAATSSGSGNSVTSTLSFGANFTDKATTVVTGQAWVGASSCIIPQVLTPSGTDPDEMYLLDLEPTISDLVAGVGFTITLYSQAEARGDYSVMCIGV